MHPQVLEMIVRISQMWIQWRAEGSAPTLLDDCNGSQIFEMSPWRWQCIRAIDDCSHGPICAEWVMKEGINSYWMIERVPRVGWVSWRLEEYQTGIGCESRGKVSWVTWRRISKGTTVTHSLLSLDIARSDWVEIDTMTMAMVCWLLDDAKRKKKMMVVL